MAILSRSRAKAGAKAGAQPIVALLVLFGLLELTARGFLFGAAGLDPRRVDSIGAIGEVGITRMAAEPALGFELIPNLDTFFKLAPFRTNGAGMRDRAAPLAKPPDTFRVAVMGSSFTLPSGVAIEAAFHSLLEARYSERFAPVRYEFLNFAVGAYQPSQALAMLEKRAAAYEPDLVLFGAGPLAAPLLGEGLVDRERYYQPGPRSHPVLHSFLWKWWRARSLDPMAIDMSNPATFEGASVLERLGAFSRRTGIPVLLVRLAMDNERNLPETLPEDARRAGLDFVDTQPAFHGRRSRDFWINALDPHPDARAHALFAEPIAAYLDAHPRRLLGR
jgi:hypothetical protein